MTWTKEQQAAIDSRGQTLLLSAAAGSGKTAVLVERIIRRLLDKDDPVDITQLLVVTFTKAAAAEMRERIAAALANELAEGDTEAAERQLALMPSAHISTLHAFCQSVIRRYFYKIDIDPGFTIAGTEELILLEHSVLETLFLSYYEDGEKAKLLYPLAEMFGSERGDDALMNEILHIYRFSRSLPWPDAWLDQAAANYDIQPETSLDALPWCTPIKQQVRRRIASSLEQLEQILPGLSLRPALAKGYEQLAAEYEMLKAVTGKEHWDELRLAMQSVNYKRLVTLKKLPDDDKAYWERCKGVRKNVKADFDALYTAYFSVTSEEWLTGLREMRPYIDGLVTLTKDFAAAYQAAKWEKNWVDFNDLEHLCLKILLDPASTPDNVIPSEAALELRESFREILMDEYQDTNGVQEMIARLVSGPDNRFMVGDIKQSIYRFRLADPTLFLEKYQSYSRAEDAPQRCIDLARNFRSDSHILEAVNAVFARTMTEGASGMSYGERERLYAGREDCTDARWLGGQIEIDLLDTGGDEALAAQSEELAAATRSDCQDAAETVFERESRFIARRLWQLKDSGQYVQRKDGKLEPIAWHHIVILLRSLKNKAEVLAQTLQAAGIPVYADESGGYFAAIEVQVILSLLRCIDNPEQDLPMASVLRSPIVGLDETALAALRLSRGDSLWQALPHYAEQLPTGQAEKISWFMTALNEWRTYSRRHSVAELLQRLYEDTGYVHFAAAMPGGSVRKANLEALYERALTYEASGYRGLFRYLQLIDKMQESQLDLAPAKVLGEGEDVVRILSIHKSKGLEFPIVILADMGKSFNERDLGNDVLLHQKLGIGLRQYDSEWRISYPNFIWSGLKAQLAWEGRAEEQRVLYVAMTRARDKLILTGTVKNIGSVWNKWAGDLDPAEGKTYFDWVMPLFAGNPQWTALQERVLSGLDGTWAQGIWQIALFYHIPDLTASGAAATVDEKLACLKRGEATGTAAPDWLDKALSFQYPYPLAARTAAKYSVSEIKRQYQLLQETALTEEQALAAKAVPEEEDAFSTPPAWLRDEQETATGARRGTVIHKIMQYLAPQPDLTEADLEQQLAGWQVCGTFTAEEAALADKKAILAFCHSPLGRRLAASAQTLREYPFSVLLPAEGVLPKAEAGEEILVQGVIDCLFREEDGWVLIDYKTDRLQDADAFRKRYGIQLALYKEAVERAGSGSVRHMYIYSFHLGKTIELT